MNSGFTLLTLGFALAVATASGDEPAPKLVPRPLPGFTMPNLKPLTDLGSTRAQSAAEAEAILQAALENKPLPPPTDAAVLPASTPETTPAATTTATPAPAATASAEADANARARVVFIHRRATLPAEFTADLAKLQDPKAGQQATAAAPPNPARQGKIRIIPKSEVATLLAPPAKSKPATP